MVQSSTLLRIVALLLLVLSTAACDAIGGIFKAGFWVGTIVVLVIVIGLMVVVSKVRS